MLGTSLATQPSPHPSALSIWIFFFLLFPRPTLHYTPTSFWDFTLIPNSHYFQWEFLYIEPSLDSKNSGKTDGLELAVRVDF